MRQVVRIIGGLYRGKKLSFPDLDDLRPTPDKVRETLFNWLMHDIRGAKCLDAFAGSGAIGIEAFSRGAGEIVFLEKSHQTYTHLQKILVGFNSPTLQLLKMDALKYLQDSNNEFDIIFLDPPFKENYLPLCISKISQNHVLKKGGLIYLESPEPLFLEEQLWLQIKAKKAGQVFYSLYEKLH